MSNRFGRVFLGVGLAFFIGTGFANGNETKKNGPKRQRPVDIKVTAWGPSQQIVDAAIERVEQSSQVQALLSGAKYRQLEFAYIDSENKTAVSESPKRFRVVFYDYSNDRSIIAESDFAGKDKIIVREAYVNPTPNDEEFNEALSILRKNSKYTSGFADGTMKASQPMPPTTILDGTTERLVNVGLRVSNSELTEVVSISIKRGDVISYESKAPPQSKAAGGSCGIPNAGQSTSSNGLAGQYQLAVNDTQGNTLWEMLIVRPSASSGTNKSGIEVRNVKYKGKSVLKRGHVPVLNVQYTPAACGPYRDWQWQEDMFATPAGSPETSPGIKVLPPGQIAETVLETGVDTGNFKGVAIYQQDVGNGVEIVLVTELQAGWYRYLHEWRFGTDGTIRPRYGFGATTSSCVCDVHNHHAYWRFDFDIVGANNQVHMLERGRKFMKLIETEMTEKKNIGTNRSLMISNSAGDEAYTVVPNKTDGLVDTFGVSDFWVLRYKNVVGGSNVQNEIDDGETCINCTNTSGPIRINPFINGESVVNQDVVVWYGAHFVHNDGANRINPDRSPDVLTGSHLVGPDLRPIRW